jgi:uncharacterized protein with NAD-binding domain and iron-sulfur cluster
MALARALGATGRSVTLFESGSRLEGKAGADLTASGDRLDHGYHIFPDWWVRALRLLALPFIALLSLF